MKGVYGTAVEKMALRYITCKLPQITTQSHNYIAVLVLTKKPMTVFQASFALASCATDESCPVCCRDVQSSPLPWLLGISRQHTRRLPFVAQEAKAMEVLDTLTCIFVNSNSTM
jgi:hypothetical protein